MKKEVGHWPNSALRIPNAAFEWFRLCRLRNAVHATLRVLRIVFVRHRKTKLLAAFKHFSVRRKVIKVKSRGWTGAVSPGDGSSRGGAQGVHWREETRGGYDRMAADKMLPDSRKPDEVEELLRNARLRDEIEPLLDDSVSWMQSERLPISVENEFLESMLQWERAPIVPISQWFDPPLDLPQPDQLSDERVGEVLNATIHRLFDKQIVLDFTDHLSDRQLYRLIYRDILPAQEKKIDSRGSYLHWDCSDMDGDPTIWLRYYATEEERLLWAEDFEGPLPPHEDPPYPRELPRAPL